MTLEFLKPTGNIHTSVGSSTTGWQFVVEPTSRTIAVNSQPPSRKISTRTLSSIPCNIKQNKISTYKVVQLKTKPENTLIG